MQRNNGGCEDEVAVRAGSKGKLPFCNVQLCSTTIVTAKTKKLSGPEISSFDGKPPFWIIHLFSARFGDCKCEEAGWAGGQQLQGKRLFCIMHHLWRKNGFVLRLNKRLRLY